MKLARAVGLQFALFLPSGLRLLKDGDSAIHRCLTVVLSTTCTVRALGSICFVPAFRLYYLACRYFALVNPQRVFHRIRVLPVACPVWPRFPIQLMTHRFVHLFSLLSSKVSLRFFPQNSLTAFPILSNRRVSLHARDRCIYFSNNRTTKTDSFKECFYIIRKIQFRLVLFVVVIGQYGNNNYSKH